MTNFKLVQQMNRTFGKLPKHDLADEQIGCQLTLVKEEYHELMEAVQAGFLPEIRKELADLLVVVYGLADLMGFDADADFAAVNDSNMSKTCVTPEEVQATAKKYYELGVFVRAECHDGEHTVFYSLFTQVGKDGKEYPAGKVLKPAHYRAVKL